MPRITKKPFILDDLMAIRQCVSDGCNKLLTASIKTSMKATPLFVALSKELADGKITKEEYAKRKAEIIAKLDKSPSIVRHHQCMLNKCMKQVAVFMEKNAPNDPINRKTFMAALRKATEANTLKK